MGNRGIVRARFVFGAIILAAAAITWGIGLMMSPEGEAVAKGTDYVRATILTFKRNGAVGTLILSALAAWLLFPRRRPKWPARDWTVAAVLVFLAGTSIYTLVSLGLPGRQPAEASANPDAAAAVAPPEMNADLSAVAATPPPPMMSPPPLPNTIVAPPPLVRMRTDNRLQAAPAEPKPGSNPEANSPPPADEPADDQSDGNQEQ